MTGHPEPTENADRGPAPEPSATAAASPTAPPAQDRPAAQPEHAGPPAKGARPWPVLTLLSGFALGLPVNALSDAFPGAFLSAVSVVLLLVTSAAYRLRRRDDRPWHQPRARFPGAHRGRGDRRRGRGIGLGLGFLSDSQALIGAPGSSSGSGGIGGGLGVQRRPPTAEPRQPQLRWSSRQGGSRTDLNLLQAGGPENAGRGSEGVHAMHDPLPQAPSRGLAKPVHTATTICERTRPLRACWLRHSPSTVILRDRA